MAYSKIERQIQIEAPPELVFQVVSEPEHIARWWPDEAHYQASSGSLGDIVVRSAEGDAVEGFEVIDVQPPRMFSFRWTQPPGVQADPRNSLLVVFELSPCGEGTLLRMTESGFSDRGWDDAALEEAYRDHCRGWDRYLPRLAPYVAVCRGRI